MSDPKSITVNVEPIVVSSIFTSCIAKMISGLTDEERAEVFNGLRDHYCDQCGRALSMDAIARCEKCADA